MLYQIHDGSVSLGGALILSHIDFEVKGSEKIAVTGRNGAGKTTLLRLIAGELDLDRDDKREGPGIVMSRRITVGMLRQQVFDDLEKTVEEELQDGCRDRDVFEREWLEYGHECDRLLTGFGFSKEDKHRKLKLFSGGEQTKIGFIRLLLSEPDILLLDEPTNHLDIAACEWLEQYLRGYGHAVVMVSHDRFFLDQVADAVYEVENRQLTRYPGNYTQYREQKAKCIKLQRKAFERQQEEIARLNEVIERFRHKPSKAAFVRAKKKQIERMGLIQTPAEADGRLFMGEISPAVRGSKWVLEAEHLKLGYDRVILELSLRIRRGQKIGLLGPNGAGKSTFLKTAAGMLRPIEGTCVLGNHITIGYFDQHSAEIHSEKSVLEHFHGLFPVMTEKEVRNILGAYLFKGKEAARRVSDLSGGEKARLVLAELLQSRPNFLILDEPTNHMDIQAKEVLESAFRAYSGTILFVSHDRYFIRQVAESVLIFENQCAFYYPFGYEHYLERSRKVRMGESIAAQIKAEDQALIAGLRAVPRVERRQLKEMPAGEVYLDWRLRPVIEKMEPAAERYAAMEKHCLRLEEELHQSEAWWEDGGQAVKEETLSACALAEKELSAAVNDCDQAWRIWHEYCLEYWDILEEVTGSAPY